MKVCITCSVDFEPEWSGYAGKQRCPKCQSERKQRLEDTRPRCPEPECGKVLRQDRVKCDCGRVYRKPRIRVPRSQLQWIPVFLELSIIELESDAYRKLTGWLKRNRYTHSSATRWWGFNRGPGDLSQDHLKAQALDRYEKIAGKPLVHWGAM